jgi:hypothetical protein
MHFRALLIAALVSCASAGLSKRQDDAQKSLTLLEDQVQNGLFNNNDGDTEAGQVDSATSPNVSFRPSPRSLCLADTRHAELHQLLQDQEPALDQRRASQGAPASSSPCTSLTPHRPALAIQPSWA